MECGDDRKIQRYKKQKERNVLVCQRQQHGESRSPETEICRETYKPASFGDDDDDVACHSDVNTPATFLTMCQHRACELIFNLPPCCVTSSTSDPYTVNSPAVPISPGVIDNCAVRQARTSARVVCAPRRGVVNDRETVRTDPHAETPFTLRSTHSFDLWAYLHAQTY